VKLKIPAHASKEGFPISGPGDMCSMVKSSRGHIIAHCFLLISLEGEWSPFFSFILVFLSLTFFSSSFNLRCFGWLRPKVFLDSNYSMSRFLFYCGERGRAVLIRGPFSLFVTNSRVPSDPPCRSKYLFGMFLRDRPRYVFPVSRILETRLRSIEGSLPFLLSIFFFFRPDTYPASRVLALHYPMW